MPRSSSRGRIVARRVRFRWSSHHTRVVISGWSSSHAWIAGHFVQVLPVGLGGGRAMEAQSRPGNGSIRARASGGQSVNQKPVTSGAAAITSSLAHSVGDTSTGPNRRPATTSSPQAVFPCTGATTPSTSITSARMVASVLSYRIEPTAQRCAAGRAGR